MFKNFKKILLILLLTVPPLTAQSINFVEERFLDAISMTFTKKGEISFDKGAIEILYKNGQKITYKEGNVTIQEDDTIHTINTDKDPSSKMMFILFDAIYSENLEPLQPFFSIKKTTNEVTLEPKKIIENYIDHIKKKKEEQRLVFLKIYFRNDDRIMIEEIN